ncbi:MAG: LD-carboxypeptidase [Bacteroidales bacterium]
MITPTPLLRGNRVGIVAPAGAFAPEKIAPALERLTLEGWEPVLGKSLYRTEGIYAGSDAERAADLADMLTDSSISAIFCARGGYGSARLLPLLERITPSHPKWIVGFSDITVLHRFVAKAWNWESLHGSLLVNLHSSSADSHRSFAAMCSVLRTGDNRFSFPALPIDSSSGMEGELVGGNLSVLYSLRGTRYDLNHLQGKILFIEEIGEYSYHLDRMLQNFMLGNLFQGLSGILVGNFSDMKEGNTPYGKSVTAILQEAFSKLDCPVIYGFPGGHEPLNMPLVMGRRVVVEMVNGEWLMREAQML